MIRNKRPDAMETDRNDSGISPGRTSSETNSNSPNLRLNSPHSGAVSPDVRANTPGESHSTQNRGAKEPQTYSKPNEYFPYYYGRNNSYPSPNIAFTLGQQQHASSAKSQSHVARSRYSPDGEYDLSKPEKGDAYSEKSNDCDFEKDEIHAEDSLERLKHALEKSSALSGIFKSRADDPDGANDAENGKKEFPCPLCAYTTPYRHRYMEHLSTHYSDKCTLCDFSGQNIHDLRAHLQDVHNISDIHDLSDPQDNNSDYQDDDEAPNKKGKAKSFKCKQCNYVTTTKLDFWEHSKGHIKAEKLLTCPKCPFVTEYKHHLEYHLRNHFGSKPFKCPKCSYSCVNKSMLNSHLKSHSNVYQYRCSDCAYATKYCHSLKLHLRKYQHKPAMVLNADGSPNPLPIIDIYGTRRGPKQKPSKTEEPDNKSVFLDLKVPDKEKGAPNLPGGIIVPNAPQISPKSPNSFYPLNNNEIKDEPHSGLAPKFYYCTVCEFHSISAEYLNQHMFLHAAETNLAHIFKTNNNLQDQKIMKEYFQSVLINHTMDQVPFIESRASPPISLVSPKAHFPIAKQATSPLDLSKPESETANEAANEAAAKRRSESASEAPQEEKKKKSESAEPKTAGNSKSSSTKHRRKGKAYKLERISDATAFSPEDFTAGKDEKPAQAQVPENKEKTAKDAEPAEIAKESAKAEAPDEKNAKTYSCIYCDIVFKDVILYTMHMGYHGFQDPFACNMCGHITPDKVAFFLHIARSSHS